jgi:large subunit ribosomal protein L5e
LKDFGVSIGLKNYAAAYCTGLLIARRLLAKVGLDKMYTGTAKADGTEYHVADHLNDEGRRPFKCVLDIGLNRATVGNRVFAVLKGAVDGGLDIPHNTKRFPGFTKGKDDDFFYIFFLAASEEAAKPAKGKAAAATEKNDGEYNPKVHRDRIFSKHVAEHMKALKADDPDEYHRHFADYIKAGIDAPEKVEAMYVKAHAAIRANPLKNVTSAETIKARKEKNKTTHKRVNRETIMNTVSGKTVPRFAKLTLAERKARLQAKIARLAAAAAEL